MRVLLTTSVFVALAVVVTSAEARVVAYPNSVVVIGDSSVTGVGSDPAHPHSDAPENSWATGTNAAVKSVYQRILALNPAIKGHASNLGQDGVGLAAFASQARRAIALKPDLVLVDIGFNDIKCDGKDASRYAAFRTAFADALTQLTTALPEARVFVIGTWGLNQATMKSQLAVRAATRASAATNSPCSLFAPKSGSLVPAHVAYFLRTLKGHDAQRAAACAQSSTCSYDGGAAERVVTTLHDEVFPFPGVPHLGITGQAKLAAAEWAAMTRLHVIG